MKSLYREMRLRKAGIKIMMLLLVVVMLAGCAEYEAVDECLTGRQYGFFGGLWHGIIAPIGFVMMLFDDTVAVYAPNNTGAWYALGFLIGSGGWGILGGKSWKRKKKRN